MPTTLSDILKQFAPYVKYIVFGITIIALIFLWKSKSNQLTELQKQMDLYKRQLAGELNQKEQELQASNNSLGVAQSKLMTQDNLLKSYQAENIKINADFEKFKKKYQVELESYQRTIAQLQSQLKGGTTVVSGGEPRLSTDPAPDQQFNAPIDPKVSKLAYDWKSGDGRFELRDPDVFSSNNETFDIHQNFRITGEIYKQKDGFLKTERLQLEEVIPMGSNTDGSINYKTVNVAQIIDSHFNYTEQAPNTFVPKKSIFGLWGVVSANLGFNNSLDNPRFLLGAGLEFVQWAGLGLGSQLYFDSNTLNDSGVGLNLSYRPTINDRQLNLALDIGLATQFRQFLQSYIPMIGIEFYIW